jgi:ribosomal protein S27E
VVGTVVIFEQKSSVDIFQPPYENAPVAHGSSNLSQSKRDDAFASPSKDDDEFWKAALEEYESSFRNKGLYAKIYSQKNGDESLVKAGYLKERFDQLKMEVKNRNLKREQIDTEYNRKQGAEEFIKSGQYRLKSVQGIDCLFFENGQAAIKVSEGKFRLYEDNNALENSVMNFLSSNMYLMTGMIKIIEIDTQFSIIGCPRCRQRTRVPKNKELQITCPSCNFGWNEKT